MNLHNALSATVTRTVWVGYEAGRRFHSTASVAWDADKAITATKAAVAEWLEVEAAELRERATDQNLCADEAEAFTAAALHLEQLATRAIQGGSDG